MDGFRARVLARLDDALDHKIALGGRRRADADRLVGHLDVARILVGVRIYRDGLDAHAACGLDHAAGDLTTIGNEDFLEHVIVLIPG